jgi:hypothetical protein
MLHLLQTDGSALGIGLPNEHRSQGIPTLFELESVACMNQRYGPFTVEGYTVTNDVGRSATNPAGRVIVSTVHDECEVLR